MTAEILIILIVFAAVIINARSPYGSKKNVYIDETTPNVFDNSSKTYSKMARPNNLVLAGKSLQAVSYMLIINALIYVIISLIIAFGYDIDSDSIEGILIGLYVIIAIISIFIISEIYKAGALLIKSGESDNN